MIIRLTFKVILLSSFSVLLNLPLLAQEIPSQRGNLRVQVSSNHKNILRQFEVYMDAEFCGNPIQVQSLKRNASGGVAQVLVWLEGSSLRSFPYPKTDVVQTEISKCQFQKHFVFVAPGSSLHVVSEDPINYDLEFVLPDGKMSFRSLPPNLKQAEIQLEKSGITKASCSLHPWMETYIVVPSHRFFASTDEKGVVEISEIPVGKYEVHLWHHQLGKWLHPSKVEVTKGQKEIQIEWNETSNTDEGSSQD